MAICTSLLEGFQGDGRTVTVGLNPSLAPPNPTLASLGTPEIGRSFGGSRERDPTHQLDQSLRRVALSQALRPGHAAAWVESESEIDLVALQTRHGQDAKALTGDRPAIPRVS